MAHTAKPDMAVIWASAGASVAPAISKIQQGWVAEKPPFQTENWVQQRQDQYLRHLDERGVPEWSNDSSYMVNSVVWYNNLRWDSLQDPNIGNVPQNGLGFWLSQDPLDARGDTMTGPLTLEDGLIIDLAAGTLDSRSLQFILSGIIRSQIIITPASDTYQIQVNDNAGASVGFLTISPAGLRFNNNNVWHAANDGPGSGLNADLLDGTQLSAILALIDAAGSQFTRYLTATVNITVPVGAVRANITVQGGGGGGGGGGDGGSSQGLAGIAGVNSVVTVGSVVITSAGGGGGSGGGPGQPQPGAGGQVATSTIVSGTFSSSSSFNGEVGGVGNPNDVPVGVGGNGGSGLRGQGRDALTVQNTISARRGGGGAGGWGQDGAPGGGGASASTIFYSQAVTPGETITIVIGGGGNGGNGGGLTASRRGTNGGTGFAIVEYA